MMLLISAFFTSIVFHFGDCNNLFRYKKYNFPAQRSSDGWGEQDGWDGKWFPHPPQQNQVQSISQLRDPKHGIKMGVPFTGCDDGKTNIDVDWDFNPVNYTCYTPKVLIPMRSENKPILTCDDIPKGYMPPHHCMDEEIHYNSTIPTYGGHRPLWPKFGEYKFVPPQRWLHNIEHGSVVMLYHPCAPKVYVDAVKSVIQACIWKHVVTPYNLVPKDTPIVLVAWGCKLEISYVDSDILSDVVEFVRAHGHKGPEGTYQKQGQYDTGLEHPSQQVPNSDEGKVLCPNFL